MKPTNRSRVRFIFTYGTLMSSADGDMGAAERALLKSFARCRGAAATRGRMFHAGACPGVVLGGAPGDVVYGELWQLPDDVPDLLAALDRYEGCTPDCPLPYPYVRRRIRVRSRDGARVTAWIYEYIRPTADLVRIADGRWRGPLRVHDATEAEQRKAVA